MALTNIPGWGFEGLPITYRYSAHERWLQQRRALPMAGKIDIRTLATISATDSVFAV